MPGITCFGCGSHGEPIAEALREAQPCPVCGLSAAAAAEVRTIRFARGLGELAGLSPYGADGREIARPGWDGLGMYLAGVRVRGLLAVKDPDDPAARLFLDFRRCYAWWRPLGDPAAAPVTFAGQFAGAGMDLPRLPARGSVVVPERFLWALYTWEAFGTEVELYAGLGRWTLLHCAGHPSVKIVVLPTMVPPDGDGTFQDPACAPDRASPASPEPAWAADPLTGLDPDGDAPPRLAEIWEDLGRPEDGDTAQVGLSAGRPDGTVYTRHWPWPANHAGLFAAMMTVQVGEPIETVYDAAGAAEFHKGTVILGASGDDDGPPS